MKKDGHEPVLEILFLVYFERDVLVTSRVAR
jgi:hypothetical protein